MPIAPEVIYRLLTELPQRRSLAAALELFDALGYQYADKLPLEENKGVTQSFISRILDNHGTTFRSRLTYDSSHRR